VATPKDDHQKARGILRYMLVKGKASRKQVAWLIGYVDGLQPKP
jgi:hypothetical protein